MNNADRSNDVRKLQRIENLSARVTSPVFHTGGARQEEKRCYVEISIFFHTAGFSTQRVGRRWMDAHANRSATQK